MNRTVLARLTYRSTGLIRELGRYLCRHRCIREGRWVFICLLWVVLYECGSGQFKEWPWFACSRFYCLSGSVGLVVVSVFDFDLVLVSIRSGLGSRLYHDNESINNVLNTDSFQCWLSACICVSRILKTGCKSGSFLHPAGKILYCFTGKQDWSLNRKARESVRFPGHKNSNILPWRPFDFILSQVTKPGLCVLKYDISSCFALYFVVCVPVKIDNKMKYFISKRKRL